MLELYAIEGDYGLVSLDVESIQSISYAQLCNIPVKIIPTSTLITLGFYRAPSIRTPNNTVIRDFRNVLEHFKDLTEDPDNGLTKMELSAALALKHTVKHKLEPVVTFTYWVDQRNCEEFTSRWYMTALPFPLNYAYTKRKKYEAAQLMEALYPLDTDPETVKEFIVQSAMDCLSIISTRLGQNRYFFWDSPRTLDIVVYAHLAPLVRLPFPSNDITAMLQLFPNLVRFVDQMDARLFPGVKKTVKYLKPEETQKQNDDEVSYMAIFILTLSATSLALGFAVKKGLIKLGN